MWARLTVILAANAVVSAVTDLSSVLDRPVESSTEVTADEIGIPLEDRLSLVDTPRVASMTSINPRSWGYLERLRDIPYKFGPRPFLAMFQDGLAPELPEMSGDLRSNTQADINNQGRIASFQHGNLAGSHLDHFKLPMMVSTSQERRSFKNSTPSQGTRPTESPRLWLISRPESAFRVSPEELQMIKESIKYTKEAEMSADLDMPERELHSKAPSVDFATVQTPEETSSRFSDALKIPTNLLNRTWAIIHTSGARIKRSPDIAIYATGATLLGGMGITAFLLARKKMRCATSHQVGPVLNVTITSTSEEDIRI